jgi:RNase P protein component
MILIARQPMQRASFQQTQAALVALFERARLFGDG